MQVVFGPDWSVGLNSRSSNALTDTVMLSRIGNGLRGLYQDLLDEPLPEFLTGFVRELDAGERTPEAQAE
jgi:anti-sigma factor NepR-like protein